MTVACGERNRHALVPEGHNVSHPVTIHVGQNSRIEIV